MVARGGRGRGDGRGDGGAAAGWRAGVAAEDEIGESLHSAAERGGDFAYNLRTWRGPRMDIDGDQSEETSLRTHPVCAAPYTRSFHAEEEKVCPDFSPVRLQ